MTSVSDGHIILTPTQPVGSGPPQPGSNPEPPHQDPRTLPTELPRPPKWTTCCFHHEALTSTYVSGTRPWRPSWLRASHHPSPISWGWNNGSINNKIHIFDMLVHRQGWVQGKKKKVKILDDNCWRKYNIFHPPKKPEFRLIFLSWPHGTRKQEAHFQPDTSN